MSVTAQELEILSTKAIGAKATAYCMLIKNTHKPKNSPSLTTIQARTPNFKLEHAS